MIREWFRLVGLVLFFSVLALDYLGVVDAMHSPFAMLTLGVAIGAMASQPIREQK